MLLQRSLLVTIMSLATASCSKSSGGSGEAAPASPAPAASAPAAAAFNSDQAVEYQQLPANVIIGVNSADSSDVTMRIPVTSGDISDQNTALAAYESGLDTTSPLGELDQSTSSQSWEPLKPQSDYSSYAPKYNSQKNNGYSYNYTISRQFNVLGMLFYVFSKPPCIPLFCAPSTYGSGPGPAAGVPVLGGGNYDSELHAAFNQYGVYGVNSSEYYTGANQEQVELGRRLFNDTLLSTSNAVACSTCHVSSHGSTTVYSLPPTGFVISGLKTGGFGASDLLARNPPSLYNLGHKSFTTMFYDSRVAESSSFNAVNGFLTPAGSLTPAGLDNALAAQALFPLATANEMAGCGAFMTGTQQSLPDTAIWSQVLSRVLAKPDYQAAFAAAFPEAGGNFGIQHLANAIAAFEAVNYRADNSPFDAYVRGNLAALSDNQKRGASYFYGKGGCGGCHSGPFQTDHQHHAVGVPQFGPGEGDGPHGWEDFGFARQTGNPADRYKFKTPSLRNVAYSGPWGHDGAFSSLNEFVAHYSNPDAALDHWDVRQVILPNGYPLDHDIQGAWTDGGARNAIKCANEFHGNGLNSDEINAITDFLTSLTDQSSLQR